LGKGDHIVEGERMAGKTKRLYIEDPYQIEFQASVIQRLSHEDHPALILDQTCFYPESGGQPADRGIIEGIAVIHVLEKEDQVVHVMETDVPVEVVRGKIDWTRRFDHMQQHAGQHVLSQCLVQLHDAATRSFHLGEKSSTLEVDLRNIGETEAERVEKLANEIVFQNKPIKSCVYTEEEVSEVRLRRPTQKKGDIRVVEITDFDSTACGGTHPHHTGEIGTIKILKWDRIRDNVRFEFICGNRALQDYVRKHRDLKTLSNSLTVDDSEVVSSYEKLVSDMKVQKKINRQLQDKVIQHEAVEIIEKAAGKFITKVITDRSQEEVRQLVLTIMRMGEFVVLMGLKGAERAHVFLACSESLGLDMRELVPVVSPLIEGKGGGRPSFVEVSGEKKENLEQTMDAAYRHINENF
jgi:alanyl-tRNA synthetase